MSPNAVTILATLGALVLERQSGERFVPRGELPAWCDKLEKGSLRVGEACVLADVFPFFELFVSEAEAIWNGTGRRRLDSGGFTQIVSHGAELHLVGTAVLLDGAPLLIVMENEQTFRHERLMLQRARELRFAHDALSREIEQRDVLTHCVVHDLRSPLNAIAGTLQALEKKPLHEAEARLVAIATRAASQQAELISDVLATFSARQSSSTPAHAMPRTDLCAIVVQIAGMMEPAARARGVAIDAVVPHAVCGHAPALTSEIDDAAVEVSADTLRLFRVIGNLVENALHYSPKGATVRIAVDEGSEAVVVGVEDEGPGVPPAFVPRLFEKFARAADGVPGTGLGLYFCRITVEGWGGAIGYAPRPEGGSRFWFRLPLLSSGSAG